MEKNEDIENISADVNSPTFTTPPRNSKWIPGSETTCGPHNTPASAKELTDGKIISRQRGFVRSPVYYQRIQAAGGSGKKTRSRSRTPLGSSPNSKTHAFRHTIVSPNNTPLKGSPSKSLRVPTNTPNRKTPRNTVIRPFNLKTEQRGVVYERAFREKREALIKHIKQMQSRFRAGKIPRWVRKLLREAKDKVAKMDATAKGNFSHTLDETTRKSPFKKHPNELATISFSKEREGKRRNGNLNSNGTSNMNINSNTNVNSSIKVNSNTNVKSSANVDSNAKVNSNTNVNSRVSVTLTRGNSRVKKALAGEFGHNIAQGSSFQTRTMKGRKSEMKLKSVSNARLIDTEEVKFIRQEVCERTNESRRNPKQERSRVCMCGRRSQSAHGRARCVIL
ncbi:hypothetical protein AAMO2058_001415700 [Amorphochlora amoebiformis]